MRRSPRFAENGMRVVIDTNVFVSSLLRSGSCRAILEVLRNEAFTLVTSEPLIGELTLVLSRPKFAGCFGPEDCRELLDLIHHQGNVVEPRSTPIAVRDVKDRPVLECLYAADLLVSGDKDLQVLTRVGTTAILSPAMFVALLKTRR